MNTSQLSKNTDSQTTKQGFLQKQSDHLKSWRQRYLEANNNFLKISKDEKGKDQKFVDTRDYGIRYNGKVKERYVLSFHLLKGKSSKYKKFVFASNDEQTIREWYDFFTNKRTDMNASFDNIKTGSFIESEDGKDESPSKSSSEVQSPEMVSPLNNFTSPTNGLEKDQSPSNSLIKPVLITKVEETLFDGDYKLPDDSPQWIEDIFYKHVKGNKIWEKDNIIKLDVEEMTDQWNIIQNSEKIKILQNLENANNFRCLFKFKETTPEQILKVLLDVKQRGKWDNSFEKAEILTYVPSSQQYLIHQVNRPFGMLYFPREFVYARYTFKSKLCYFMIDKSAENCDLVPKSIKCPRGSITYSIIQLVQIKNEVFLNLFLNITNGGIVTTSQDAQITVFALNNYVEIPKVFYDYPSDYKLELLSMPDISAEKPKKIEINDRSSSFKSLTIEIDKEMSKKEEVKDDAKSVASEDRNGDDDDESETQEEAGKEEITTNNNSSDGNQVIRSDDGRSKEFWLKRYDKVTHKKHTLECVDKATSLRKLTNDEVESKYTADQGSSLLGKVWKRDPANGLELLDKELLDNQRRVLGHFLRTMGKNLFEGKSIMSISMPITIFSDDSMLQRVPSGYGYLPYYLPKAAQAADAMEAFKNIVAFFYTTCSLGLRQEKPFNPILGETYQGFINGIPVFCEQILHHPPVSALYIKQPGYTIHGTYQVDANLGLNSATGSQKGRMCVSIEKFGLEIYAYFPSAVISGTVTGRRIFNWTKKMRVFEKKNNWYADMQFNPDEKGMLSSLFSKKVQIEADKVNIRGMIYQVIPEYIAELLTKEGAKSKFDEKKHAVREICELEGLWTNHFDIDGKRYWSIEQPPYKLIDFPNKALPSDASYREDLMYRKMGDLTNGQIQKEKLENIQRADRKLRGKKH